MAITEASGKSGSTNMGIEDLGSVSQGSQGRNGHLRPTRSGSVPPSIEGSFSAIGNLMFRPNLATEEQLRADPSYFEYYRAHVNLNPRLPPPLTSGGNRNPSHNIRGTESNRRLTSFDDDSSRSLWLDHGNLSPHKEESDNDRSPKPVDLPQAQSPASNQSHMVIQEPDVEATNHAASDSKLTTVSSSSSISGNAIKPPVNTSSSIRSQDHVSLNISNSLNVENENDPQQRNPLPAPYPQNMSLAQTYVGMNCFPQTPANFSSELQPPLHSLTPVYPNMMPAGYYLQQYTIGGYAFNQTPFSPDDIQCLPNNPFQTPFDNMAPNFSGQSSGVNVHQVNNFYGHFGIPFLWEEHMLESVGSINLNSTSVNTMNPYHLRSPTNMDFLQVPNSPFASSLMMGSPIGGRTGDYVSNDRKTISLLKGLTSGKSRRLELSDIFGHIVGFSVNQNGSRFLQQKLAVCSNEERESVFKEVLPHAMTLITDAYGNYVIQKIIESGTDEHRREFGNQIEGQILPLSLHTYGCRVIQKAMEAFELEEKIKILNELDGHVIKCVLDQNGNHVIQRCIEHLPIKNIEIVISSFHGLVLALSKEHYGCRVIQSILEHATEEPECQFLLEGILDSVFDLAQDQHGNYVIQCALRVGKPEERSQIVDKLAGHIVRLSQHKYASNVVEKCFEYGDEDARELIVKEITEDAEGNDNLLVMMKDQYANYVVQKVLQTSRGHQREVLLGCIKFHLNSMKDDACGGKIVTRFKKLYGEEDKASRSELAAEE